LKSVLDSPIVRNAVAAALASAAAALLYRKSTEVDDRADVDWAVDDDVAVYEVPRAKRSTAKKMRQKATAAAGSLSTATGAAVSKAARSEVAEVAKAVVKKTAKAAAKKTAKAAVARTVDAIVGTQRGRKAAVEAEPAAGAGTIQRLRKTRSDSGVSRTPRKTRAELGVPSATEFGSVADTETSAIAVSSSAAIIPEVMPGATDEQTAEGHQS
jgi:hypothetical protein